MNNEIYNEVLRVIEVSKKVPSLIIRIPGRKTKKKKETSEALQRLLDHIAPDFHEKIRDMMIFGVGISEFNSVDVKYVPHLDVFKE